MISARLFLRWLAVIISVTLVLVWAQAALAAAPTLLSLSPASVAFGSPAFTLTINGIDFTSGSTAKWGAIALTTTYTSDTELTAAVPANLITSAGVASITVTEDGGDSSGATFTIISPPLAVSGLNPAEADVNEASVPASQFAAAPATSVRVAAADGVSSQAALPVNLRSSTIPASATTDQSAAQKAPAVSLSPVDAATVAALKDTLPVNPPSSTTSNASPTSSMAGGTAATNFKVKAVSGGSSGAIFDVSPPSPDITSLSPASAAAGGAAFMLTVNGDNFTSAATVSWGSASLATIYFSASQLMAAVPASLIATAGTVSLTVTTEVGTSTPVAFSILAMPLISYLSPNWVTADGASFTMIINGSNFLPTSSTVKWVDASGGLTFLSATYISSTQISVEVPASLITSARAGAGYPYVYVGIYVYTSGGYGWSWGMGFAIVPAPPTITSTSPTSVPASSGTFTLTINGSNFRTGQGPTVVKWDYSALATTYVSPTQITGVVPASLISSARTLLISVSTANGVPSNFFFTINQAKPVITSLSSSNVWSPIGAAVVGQGDFTLIVWGNYFDPTEVVNWGSTPLVTTFINSTVLTAAVPASLTATAGSVSLTVTTEGGTSAPVAFPILAMPAINCLRPNAVFAGGDSFTLIINGSNFLPTSSTVKWLDVSGGLTFLSATYISPTQVSVEVPASLITSASAGAGYPYVYVGVSIYTPGGYGWSAGMGFAIVLAPPAITSLTPSSVNAGGAGLSMTITGTRFTSEATTVSWGTTSLSTVYISPTQLSVAIPASLIEFPGTARITVASAYGTSAPATFTINPAPPAISTLSPGLVIAGGSAFTLTIRGEYFTSNAIAHWGSTALATTVISQNQLTAVVPASLIAGPGAASVSVTTSAGSSVSLTFTINPAIKITTSTLPDGTAGNAYSGAINVIGGFPGYTWTVTGLPDSMSFFNTSGSTLTITGTPASPGAISFQVSVQDTVGAAAGPVNYTINVAAGPSGANNGSLKGSYVCLLQGSIDTDGTRWATLASFQADGRGNFTGGAFDTNSYDIGSGSGTMTGSYNIGADNNGMASIQTILTEGAAGIQTTQWAIALNGAAQPAQQFRMVEADDLGTLPSYQQGTANCYLATTSAFAASTISGSSFAFGLDGEDNSGNMKSAVGLFSASGGKITNGNIDMAQGGNTTVQTYAFTATYTTPDSVSGRFTIALNGAGNSTDFTVYIIDASRMFILDNTNNNGELAGNIRTMQQSMTNAASVAGPFVLYMRGAEFNNNGNTPSGFYADVFQGTGDGAGNITINKSYKNDAGVYSAGNSNYGPAALAFDSVHPGRATFQSAGGTTYLYLFDNNSAFEMEVKNNGALDSGWLESQTATQTPSAFTNASLAGNYLFGDLSQLNIEPISSVGVLAVTSGGTINAALTTTSRGNLSWDHSTSTTYSWDATAPGTGSFLVSNGAQASASCAVISATKFVCISQTDPAPSVEVFEQ
jgi:hypothetical protein